VVIRVCRRGQAVGGNAQVIGEEVPRPVDRFPLEVVAEAPVAEHFEERVVAGRPAHFLEVVVFARYAEHSLVVDALVYERVEAPVRTSLNWTMPLFVKRRVWSPAGTRLAEGTTA